MPPEDRWADQSTFACRTCRFYVPKQKVQAPDQLLEVELGRCRRNAPIVEQGWPVVYSTDWCGQHKIARLS